MWGDAWVFSLWLVVAVGCSADDTFQCVSSDQCSPDGTCEDNQYCSFPDLDCESGRRFGDRSAAGIAGQCVPVETGSTGSVEPVTSSSAPTSATTTTIDPSTSGDPSSGGGGTTWGDESTSGASTTGVDETLGEGSSGSSGFDPCSSSCQGCFECIADGGGPCDMEAFACLAAQECAMVHACLEWCVAGAGCVSGCCDNVDSVMVDLAFALLQCQSAACQAEPVCDQISSPAC